MTVVTVELNYAKVMRVAIIGNIFSDSFSSKRASQRVTKVSADNSNRSFDSVEIGGSGYVEEMLVLGALLLTDLGRRE